VGSSYSTKLKYDRTNARGDVVAKRGGFLVGGIGPRTGPTEGRCV